MRLTGFIQEGREALLALYPAPEAGNIVTRLFTARLGLAAHTPLVHPETALSLEEEKQLRADLARLLRGEPLQYVLGTTPFFGRDFKVSPAVLIPRPETELLVEKALGCIDALSAERTGLRVLDLCTGSGCIAWTLLRERPSLCMTAVDLSAEALEVARSQFPDGPSPHFVQADVLARPRIDGGPFDVMVSNPPYILEGQKPEMRRNVLDFEPEMALFVPDADPLVFYRAIADIALQQLAPGGAGLVEINDALGPETARLFAEAGFSDVALLPDLSGRDRFVQFFAPDAK